jgi:hypothetical protein
MASFVTFIRTDYLDKNREGSVLIQYDHLYKKWRFNTGIKVNPEIFKCVFDEDTELWKLSPIRQLKSAERKKMMEANEVLRNLNLRLTKIILDLKARSLSLSPANVEAEFNKDDGASFNRARNKTVLEWYQEFISAKEKEIGAGINSYRSTHEHFKTYLCGKGVAHLQDLTKQFLEEFRADLEKLNLSGPTIHKQFKNLRIFLNWISAHDENGHISIPVAYKKLKAKARYGDPIGLTVDQFFQFLRVDLNKRPLLERTRDVFVFGVSIGGPRHGDLKRLADTLRRKRIETKPEYHQLF